MTEPPAWAAGFPCSTPFGVIGLFTRRRKNIRMASLFVLNAVWRHWIVHQAERDRLFPARQVLNAVWRHWIVHGRGDDNRRRKSLVLNAVWRHWIVHYRTGDMPIEDWECSTPFGVIGLFTTATGTARGHVPGAQRRLASLDCSRLFNSISQASRQTCSTPFGVIGLFTGTGIGKQMLRHWCSTPFGVIGLFTRHLHRAPAAKPRVLNAVWRHWIVHLRIGRVTRPR